MRLRAVLANVLRPSSIVWRSESVGARSRTIGRRSRRPGRAPSPRFLGASHGASVALAPDPQNGRSLRRAYAVAAVPTWVTTGVISLAGSHDRLEAKGPGRWRTVKAASRRSRSRAARALTAASGPAATCFKAIMARRGDEAREFKTMHRLAQNRRLQAKNAPRCRLLILFPSSAVRPPRTSRFLSCNQAVGVLRLAIPARPFAKVRSDKIRTKNPGKMFRCRIVAVIARRPRWPQVRRVSPDRAKSGRRSCDGCARCLQIERRKATSRWVSVERGNVRCCG
jgi:hypothetical protein